MKNTEELSPAAAPVAPGQHPIPNPPGGGSWRFDQASWAWVANDPEVKPDPVQE